MSGDPARNRPVASLRRWLVPRATLAALTGTVAHTYHNDIPSIQVVSMRVQADILLAGIAIDDGSQQDTQAGMSIPRPTPTPPPATLVHLSPLPDLQGSASLPALPDLPGVPGVPGVPGPGGPGDGP